MFLLITLFDRSPEGNFMVMKLLSNHESNAQKSNRPIFFSRLSPCHIDFSSISICHIV
jgi:hypothetical protein